MDNHIFRSALNGFNRQDVMEYIERTQKEAAGNIEQLEAELQTVRQELNETRQQLEECENAKDAVSAELSGYLYHRFWLSLRKIERLFCIREERQHFLSYET